MKTTVKVSTDVAFIKYWGKKDEKLRIPENDSISMVLDGLDTVTTVEFQKSLASDDITLEGGFTKQEVDRVKKHLDRIRESAGITTFAKVVSQNSFPASTGLSSSGSGFAALTIAAFYAAGFSLSERKLSILARLASGTACRCVCGGFVQWHAGKSSKTSFSQSIFPSNHWDLRDVIAIVSEEKKHISSTMGHKNARTSPFFSERQRHISKKLKSLKLFIENREFAVFGQLVEKEALEFHSILLTSTPSLIAWHPGTVQVMHEVQCLRKEGIECYFTINTGFNIHVLTLQRFENQVRERLESLSLVQKTLTAKVGSGPKHQEKHLF